MRSLLVQASSVEKAFEKAWVDAGMPTEFTIKVLDFGQKGFLGITKKPAIVSIIYQPRKQTAVSSKRQEHIKITQKRRPEQPKRIIPKERPREIRKEPFVKKQFTERHFWSDMLVHDITNWLTDILKKINLQPGFKANVNLKALTITFDRDVLKTKEEERLLFSSLSYLLIQFLKKKHKKKYQGYQLIITSRRFMIKR
jgi:predicted RNA-binding protein Jag